MRRFVIEIKIQRKYASTRRPFFFGLTARQFFCYQPPWGLAGALGLGGHGQGHRQLGVHPGRRACGPLAGFFHYNGMTLEQFLWAVVKSEFLLAGGRPFVSENFYYDLLRRKGRAGL